MQQSRTIKISYGNDTRRSVLPSYVFTFAILSEKIESLFGLQGKSYHIRYCDQEGDWITFSTDDELSVYLSENPDGILRFSVQGKKNSVPQNLPIHSIPTRSIPPRPIPTNPPTHSVDGIPEDKLAYLKELGLTDEEYLRKKLRKYTNAQKDFDRIVQKLLAKKDKHEIKKRKRESKQEWKDQKKQLKMAASRTKREMKVARRREKYGSAPSDRAAEAIDWQKVTTLYLDGNNMMFLCRTLRELTLGKQRKTVEAVLALIAKDFAADQLLKHVVVVFDSTSLPNDQQVDATTGMTYEFICARPDFDTSDDLLVERLRLSGNGPSSVFVTSDRELTERLRIGEAFVIRPKEWLESAGRVLTNSAQLNLDAWIQQRVTSITSPSPVQEPQAMET